MGYFEGCLGGRIGVSVARVLLAVRENRLEDNIPQTFPRKYSLVTGGVSSFF